MKDKILRVLRDNKGEFVSGQQISDVLNVSRTAVWKYINVLKEDGYDIESISRKGHRLVASPDTLTYIEVSEYLATKYIGREIIHFDSIDSTNIKAKELASKGCDDGTVVISEQQTSGRGRLGRSWVSPKGKGIWMSVVLRPEINPTDATKITQIGAAAVWEAMNSLGIIAYIKWPNDIVINGKKVCGILTEMSGELNRLNYLVIGIGINVNIDGDSFSEEVNKVATSIKQEIGREVPRRELVAMILNKFEELYEELVNHGTIKKSIKICRENSILIGKKIKIISKEQELERKAIGINDEGQLLIEDDMGNVSPLISGEVSVRGVYGYV